MQKEIATKNNNGPYYKCTHCGDEIFWNTHKKLIECKCKKLWVDGCEDYACPVVNASRSTTGVRIGGNEKDYEVIHK